jgi:hypothetical protein
MPGDNYPSDLKYTDGTSMCYEAWGGWYQDPCEKNGEQFPCKSITALDVIDDVSESVGPLPDFSRCLSIIYPTGDTLDVYEETREPPDACIPEAPSRLGIFIVVLATVTVSLTVCGALIYMHARHRQAEEDFS